MRVQLIECFAADAARTAVLEQEDGPFAGFVDGLVESGDVENGVQLFHAVPSFYRAKTLYPAGPFGAATPVIDANGYENRPIPALFWPR